MPGSTPPTSQLDWLISTTTISVLSWSRATRDLLKSFGWGIRALHQLDAATMVPSPRRLPHTISPVVRPNRDTLYSGAVFDYDTGPVTITLPDAGNRFMSMQVIDEDQYAHAVYYGAGRYTMTREEMGTCKGSLETAFRAKPETHETAKQ